MEEEGASGRIRAISKAATHRICSGQVVLDLATAIKELVENAIDAGATNVEVKLRDHGCELIEVSDNGSGVKPQDFQGLTLKYHTSKIHGFEDLQSLSSYGFRGEALSSLCALCEKLTVVTRAEGQEVGSRLEFDTQGLLVATRSCARALGTTVAIKGLFKPLPVRHKEFCRHLKREYRKALNLIQAYALINTSVRLLVTHQPSSNQGEQGGKSTASSSLSSSFVLATAGGETSCLKDTIISVLGTRVLDAMMQIDLDPEDLNLDGSSIHGYVSKAGEGSRGGGSDPSSPAGLKQFIFINKRPIDLHSLSKAVQDAFKSLGSSSGAQGTLRPHFILHLTLPPEHCDVNVTPDKRKVFIVNEDKILRVIESKLKELWEPSRHSYPLNDKDATVLSRNKGKAIAKAEEEDAPQRGKKRPNSSLIDMDKEEEEEEEGEEGEKDRALVVINSMGGGEVGVAVEKAGSNSHERRTGVGGGEISMRTSKKASFLSKLQPQHKRSSERTNTASRSNYQQPDERPSAPEVMDERQQEEREEEEEEMEEVNARDHVKPGGGVHDNDDSSEAVGDVAMDEEGEEEGEEVVIEEPLDVPLSLPEVKLSVDLGRIRNSNEAMVRLILSSSNPSSKRSSNQGQPSAVPFLSRGRFASSSLLSVAEGQGKEGGEEGRAAEKELSRIFDRRDFSRLQVIGQFNLSFILARLGRDLFVVDQHAADERTNFERIQKSLVLNKQPMISPLPLTRSMFEFSALDQDLIRDHLDLFQRNGFDFIELRVAGPQSEASSSELALSAVPYSKSLVLGIEDVAEMLEMIKSGERLGDIRPSKVKTMIASRACRSSIMVGRGLGEGSMKKVLMGMEALDNPWVCAHGRPTLRHVCTLPSEHDGI